MARRRLGVVLLLPEPAATEVQGLRRACGDPMLERVAPHLTLVPPVNVREEDVPEALAVMRSAAGGSGPLDLTLGRVATFHPVNPVLYLDVGGDAADLVALREAGSLSPLQRKVDHPFVAHVTLAAEMGAPRIEHALVALADYETEIHVDRLHVLEEQRDEAGERVWRPIADAALGPRVVVSRGGLELELSITERMDPEVEAWSESEWSRVGPAPRAEATVVVTARRGGKPVGVLEGSIVDGVPRAERVIVGEDVRGEGIARHLLAWFGTVGEA